jgi:hypothetical protein
MNSDFNIYTKYVAYEVFVKEPLERIMKAEQINAKFLIPLSKPLKKLNMRKF